MTFKKKKDRKLTELPMVATEFRARSTLVPSVLNANERIMWEQNSTQIPTA